jgi:hypothetical protein
VEYAIPDHVDFDVGGVSVKVPVSVNTRAAASP